MQGQIVRLVKNRGFGFIRTMGNEEYFFHMDNLQGVTFDEVVKDFDGGQEIMVEFDPTSSPKGNQALNIERIS